MGLEGVGYIGDLGGATKREFHVQAEPIDRVAQGERTEVRVELR